MGRCVAAGVDKPGSIVGLTPRPLTTADPERYGTLFHPGDSFSYDVFSQAGQAIPPENRSRTAGVL